ncbi:Structure-specific endonuclease subunit SLX4 [Armadillidium vulgare]|nr:Structure-specific endonuclease subunit SLX4 [Armadillidium vulgare]
MKSKKKVETKQKGNSLLDQTANDFEDDKVLFRYPKNTVDETQVFDSKLKSRGRPKKSSKTTSKITTNMLLLGQSQDVKSGSLEDLSELEKSICSESEKLCPSCKHIVLIDEYPNHVSKCLQKFSYTKDKSSSKENISRNLPCPVCLKVFTSTTEKQNHVKMCGFSHGLTPQQLIEANKLQAKQEEERLALGLPSPQVVQSLKDIRKKPDGAKPRGSKSSDPELELAYALSRSLVEDERKKREIEEDNLASLGLNDILQEKRRKLALPQPPPLSSSNKGTRGLKGRRKGKVLTILMTRTQEVRERIITEKVAAILAGEFDTPIILPENRSNVKQTSKFIYDDLYDKDSDMENDDESDVGAPVETTIVDAYCTQLALAELLCTQNIEDLTFSTDDDVTQVAKKNSENLQESTECEEKESNKKNLLQSHDERGENCKITNDANLICLSSDDDNATSSTVSFSPEKIQREKLEKAPVNSVGFCDYRECQSFGENSDLVIVTEGSKIPVHSLVLFCRCSKILAEVIEEESYPTNGIFSPKKKWLNWCEFSFEAAYAFIVYLYTGGCPVKRKDKDGTWLGLYDLALKYSCSELIEHLESMYKTASDDGPVKENAENLEKCSVSESIGQFSKQTISQTLVNNNCSLTESQRIPLTVHECNSPDIFDEWEDSSVNSNPSVKNTPVLSLDDKSPNYFANITNDSTIKSKDDDDDNNKCAQNKIIGTNKRHQEISKRNLSSEFKDLADGHTSGNHDSVGNMPESPLRMSSFSDLDYPSGNEIVDLTVSSDSEDEKGKKNSPCKQDCSKSLVKKVISLSAIELQDDNVGNSSNLSALIDKSILNTPKNNSFDLPNIEIPSPQHSSDNVMVRRTAIHGISDDSLLNAVCDIEKGIQGVSERKIENNFKTPLQKFYKSKSYSEASPRTLVTPNKGGAELLDSKFNITPMPDYKSMLSPDLKIQKKRKAFEDSFESSQKSLPPPSPIPDKRTGKTKGNNALRGKKTNAKKSSDVDLNSSLSSNTSADTSFECLEETFLPCSQDEADDISATQEVSFENRIKTFIRSDEELYSQILKYDPIWANELLRNLKLNGIKCSMAKLISFLDEQCITFRLPTKGRTRKRRRKNTSSPGKSPKKRRK